MAFSLGIDTLLKHILVNQYIIASFLPYDAGPSERLCAIIGTGALLVCGKKSNNFNKGKSKWRFKINQNAWKTFEIKN